MVELRLCCWHVQCAAHLRCHHVYVSLHFNIRCFSQWKLNIALACVVAFAMLSTCFWLTLAESQAVARCKIQGSFSMVTFGGNMPGSITLEVVRVAIVLLPLIISVVLSRVLFYRKVRSSVLNFDRAMLLSFLRLLSVLAFGSFLWNLLTFLLHFASFDGTQQSFIEMLSSYMLQLNFVIFSLHAQGCEEGCLSPVLVGMPGGERRGARLDSAYYSSWRPLATSG